MQAASNPSSKFNQIKSLSKSAKANLLGIIVPEVRRSMVNNRRQSSTEITQRKRREEKKRRGSSRKRLTRTRIYTG